MIKFVKNGFSNLYFLTVLICLIYQLLTFGYQFGLTNSDHISQRPYFLILMAFLLIGTALIIYLLSQREKHFSLLILLLCVFGLSYLFLTPIGASPDENSHFVRSYALSRGDFINVSNGAGDIGAFLPEDTAQILDHSIESTYSEVRSLLSLYESESSLRFISCSNISLYAFTCHLPQAIGFLIGHMLHLPLYIMALLGRLMNFSAYFLMCYFALKKTPVLKITMAILMLLPTTLQVASSLSADAQALGLCFLLFALALDGASDSKKRFVLKDYVLFSALMIFISLCKIVYLPVALVLFLIPGDRFIDARGRHWKWIFLPSLLIISVVINLLWLSTAMMLLADTTRRATDPTGQIQLILSQLPRFLMILLRTMWTDLFQNLMDMVGALQSFNLHLGQSTMLALIFTLILTAIVEPQTIRYRQLSSQTRTLHAWFLFVLFFGIYIASLTALYVQWTNYGYDLVIGFQGRYWTPILPFILLMINGRIPSGTVKQTDLSKYVALVLSFANFEGLAMIFLNHATL